VPLICASRLVKKSKAYGIGRAGLEICRQAPRDNSTRNQVLRTAVAKAQWIDDFQERELIKICVASADLPDAVTSDQQRLGSKLFHWNGFLRMQSSIPRPNHPRPVDRMGELQPISGIVLPRSNKIRANLHSANLRCLADRKRIAGPHRWRWLM